ncbi:Hypothetical Protein FCC1311_052622 [Hondaea fermentalgiana]|uniref:GST N-terminal domain-containing protein n=1 Tax=Hondaea fermentalgiana TaxID=2315210 RepID=A0A2R5GDN5_9STRA|nr:Hypothetical Protein FCC1311_052622 [Hondaea fermentalgiana]|eukprot:GBG29040.1 Hypothetical Protein FCC1311_052622 [Hondaea fermentalgiana]
METSRAKPVLCTITVSHYAESARWALEAAKVDFEERSGVPGLHMLPGVLPAKPGTSRKQVPYLLVPGGKDRLDSWSILEYAAECAPELGPVPSARLQELVDELGVCCRCIAYSELLGDSQTMGKLASKESRAQRAMWYLLGGVIGRGIYKQYVRNDEYVAKKMARADELIPLIEQELGMTDGSTHPTELTLSNIATSAISYPLVAPPNLFNGAHFAPEFDQVSEAVRTKVGEKYRKTELGKFVVRMYEAQRLLSK